ncbi:MAG: carbonic anhydrase, partial [Ilumatobacteraceae bacterium]
RFSNDELWDRLQDHYGVDATDIDFLPFDEVGPSVVEDVRVLRAHPLIPDDIPIRGFVWNVRTGFLEEVPEAHIN